MVNIAITFFSGHGHTRRLAEQIAGGIGQEGGNARLVDVSELSQTDWRAMQAADGILFGAPTYMGSVAAEFKSFMDASSDIWTEQSWADKTAGGFTVATFPSGDKLSSLTQLAVFAAQHGMIWVGQNQIGAPVRSEEPDINPTGSWLGLAATSSRDKSQLIGPGDLETARRFGQRMATATRRWTG